MVIGWRGGATCNCGREQSEQQIPGVDGRICTASRTIPLISRDVLLTSSWFPTDMFVTEDRWLWESMSIDFWSRWVRGGNVGSFQAFMARRRWWSRLGHGETEGEAQEWHRPEIGSDQLPKRGKALLVWILIWRVLLKSRQDCFPICA